MVLMEIAAFDTHDFVKRLTGAGMPEPQAEVLAIEQSRLLKERLATKQDTAELKHGTAELKRDVAELKRETAELKRDVAELKHETAELKRDVAEIKLEITDIKREIAELKRDIKEMEQKLTIRLGGIVIAGIAVLVALDKLL